MDILGLLSDFELKKIEINYRWGVSENFFPVKSTGAFDSLTIKKRSFVVVMAWY